MTVPAGARRRLRNLAVSQVDIVTAGANEDQASGEGSRILLWKAAPTAEGGQPANPFARKPASGPNSPGPANLSVRQRGDSWFIVDADNKPVGRPYPDRETAMRAMAAMKPGTAKARGTAATVNANSSRAAGLPARKGGRSMAPRRKAQDDFEKAGPTPNPDPAHGTDEDHENDYSAPPEGEHEEAGTFVTDEDDDGDEDDDEPTRSERPRLRRPAARPSSPATNDDVEKRLAKMRADFDQELAGVRAENRQLKKAWDERVAAETNRIFLGKAREYGVIGDAEAIADVLKACAGVSPDLLAKAETLLSTAAARVELAKDRVGLFGERGASHVDGITASDDAVNFGKSGGQLMALAKEIAKAQNITVEAATVAAMEQRPDLYGEYLQSLERR